MVVPSLLLNMEVARERRIKVKAPMVDMMMVVVKKKEEEEKVLVRPRILTKKGTTMSRAKKKTMRARSA